MEAQPEGRHIRTHKAKPKSHRFLIGAVIFFVAAMAFAIVHHATLDQAANPNTLSVVEECQQALGYQARTVADIEWLNQCVSALTPPTGTPTTPPTTPPSSTTTPSTPPSPSSSTTTSSAPSTAPPTTGPTSTPTTSTPSPTPPPTTSTPSPSPTISSTPPATSPGPTGSPTGPCTPVPSACGLPDATNTGASGTLAAWTGSLSFATDGAVIENVSINGCLDITGVNITFHNVKISCTTGGYAAYTGRIRDGKHAYDVGTTTFDHVTVTCAGNNGGTAFGDGHITVKYANISLCENGADADKYVIMTRSYIHDMDKNPVAHTDGLQMWPSAPGIVFSFNTALMTGDNATFTAGNGNTPIVVQGNLLVGGSFTVYCANHPGQLKDNRWGPIFPGTGYPAGHTDGCTNMTWSGNVLDSTGTPIAVGS